MNFKRWFIIASSFTLLSVAMGAFAAHALKAQFGEYELSIIETAARYQMYHGLAIFFVTLLGLFVSQQRKDCRVLISANITFTLGILLFSGSLYLLALYGVKWMVFLTPIGGVSFIIAWSILIWFFARTDFKSLFEE